MIKPKIKTTKYIVRNLSINKDRQVGFKKLNEYSVQFNTISYNKEGASNLEFKYLYFLISEYSVYKNNTEIYDTRKKDIKQITIFANSHKTLIKNLNNSYTISLNNKGEIIKDWNLKNKSSLSHGVFDMSIFQIIFPNKSLDIDEEWEYESKGVFENFLKSKKKFWVKEIINGEICIGYRSELISEDLFNG